MDRRNAFKFLSILGLAPLAVRVQASTPVAAPEIVDRKYWLNALIRIAKPVLESLSKGELRKNMPVECKPGMEADRQK